MQSDGNLVEYVDGAAVWASAAPPAPATTDTLTINNRLSSGQQLTSSNGAYQFLMQSDGNAVLYAPGGGTTFATGTSGHPGAFLLMQSDGNAVVYGPKALWQSGTSGRGGNRLLMQTDGNLVLYSNTNTALFVAPPPPAPTSPTPPPSSPPQQGVTPGAFCSPPGAVGYSSAGNRYICSQYSDGRYRWKRG